MKQPRNLIILALTLLAFGLRTYRLGFQSLWIDEAWTVYFANLSLAELWHLLQTTEIKPPFYFPAMIYWVKLAGQSEFALRYFSVLFGVLAVPFMYRLGLALSDRRLGLIAALLLTVAPYQIWHAQDARMYSIVTAWSLMGMWGFVNIWQRGGWRWWAVYVMGMWLAIITHYHALLLIGSQGLFLLLNGRRYWRYYLKWAASLLLMFGLYLPWLLFGSSLLQGYLNWVPQPTLAQAFTRSAIAYSLSELVPSPQAFYLIALFVAAYGLGLVYAASRRWRTWSGWAMVTFLLSYTIAPHLAAWLYGELKTPAYLERYLIITQGGYLLAVALGVLALADGLPVVVNRLRGKSAPSPMLVRLGKLAAALLLMTLVAIDSWVLWQHYTNPAYAKPDWRAVAQTVATFGLPGDAILLTGDGGELAFAYYANGDYADTNAFDGKLSVYASFNLLPPTHPDYRKGRPGVDRPAAIMADLAARYRRIWFTPYGVEIDPTLEQWLAENSHPAWHSWLGKKRLALYQTSLPLNRHERLDIAFADTVGPRLLSADLSTEATAAGDVLPVTLTWQTNTPLPTDYQLSLRLINSLGDTFTQSDWPPLTATAPTSAWPINQPIPDQRALWIPADTPPGNYLLQLVLYNPANGQPLGQPVTINNIAIAAATLTPPLSALNIPNPLPPQTDTQPVKLVGYALPSEIQPGQEMWLWLYWQAAAPVAADIPIQLTLTGGDQTQTFPLSLANSVGELATWQPGQVRRAVYHLPTSPHLNGDTAQLSLALPQANIAIGTLKLLTRSRTFDAPDVVKPLNVAIGNPPLLLLHGLNNEQLAMSNEQGLNSQVNVDLVWQAEAEMETNYTVFVQLLNPAGQVVTQVDVQPLAGAAPTTTWLPGEFLSDTYTLTLPPDLPPGNYRLITGLYNATTGERLPVDNGGDFVALGEITVQ